MKSSDLAALLNEPACTHNLKSKSGCARPTPGATAGGCTCHRRRLHLRWRADRLATHRRRRPHRARPERLRRQLLGQSWHPLQRPDPVQDRYDHRPERARCHHGTRREAPVSRRETGHRPLFPSSGVRLQHLCHRSDRRRSGSRVQSGDATLERAGDPGGRRRFLRQQKPRSTATKTSATGWLARR